MRCDLCMIYRPNVEASDQRADICKVYEKTIPGFHPDPETVICDGCANTDENAVLFTTNCAARKCVLEKGYIHCGCCDAYPCEIFPGEPTREELHQKIDIEQQWTWEDEKRMEAYNCRQFMDEFRSRIFTLTDRLILRQVSRKDAEIMFDYRNNEICARYQRGQTKDLQGIIALVERRKDDVMTVDAPFMVAVALKSNDEMIGEIVVMPNEGTISLGYTFSYQYHRRGYAFEALKTLIELLHERYPEWDFICFTEPENEPSMALLRKLGYKDMGYLPSRKSQVFGKWTKPETEAEIEQAVR